MLSVAQGLIFRGIAFLTLIGRTPSRSLFCLCSDELLVITAATEVNDGYLRFMRTIRQFNYTVQVLGLGEEWKGGDVARTVGGGQKVRWLKKELEKHKDKQNMVIMFVDSYDVILASGPEELLKKFSRFSHRVVFSAEGFCWPDQRLASKYPVVHHGKRYLNSGGILTHYYLKLLNFLAGLTVYLTSVQETCLKTVIICVICFGSLVTYELFVVLCLQLNYLGNYVPSAWTYEHGCGICDDDLLDLNGDEEMPLVHVAVFIEQPTPFLEEFLERLATLIYPHTRLRLFIHNNVVYHEQHVEQFWTRHRSLFPGARIIGPEENLRQDQARTMAVEACKKDVSCDYFFSIDSDVALTNPDVLRILIEENKAVIAPMLSRHGKLWSNFWGALSPEGFYSRSEDYIDIVQSKRVGLWNVPYITQVYLIRGETLRSRLAPVSLYQQEGMDPDMIFCKSVREQGVFMFVSNRDEFGRLISSTNYNISRLHPDMWQIFDNPVDWREKYIHEDYSKIFEDDENFVEQPCPDVYWFPAFSERMCDELVETMEDFGGWSGGKNKDERLSGGYENVPTVDIHMNQIQYEKEWLKFLKDYIVPVTEKLYPGYYPKVYIFIFL
uniref:Procollagen-lysine,2-oxoglutarate 5-dioxygenase 3-like n=1 Tax=Sinocyclocheilus anshuiensis TaxID=1608454 RepID=A0A671PCY0_9TELE